jgi:hypothetical protein
VNESILCRNKELIQDGQNLLLVIPHANLPSNISLLDGRLMQVIVVEKAAVSQVLDQRQMMCV